MRTAATLTSVAAVALLGTATAGGTGSPGADAEPGNDGGPYAVSRIDAPDPQSSGRWAERLAAAAIAGRGGDLDGDRVPDFFVGQPQYDTANASNAGRVWAISGATGDVAYRIDAPVPQQDAKVGFFISVLGDVDGDGTSDVAAGTDAQDVGGNADQGAAWVFSGATGDRLYRLDNPAPQPGGRFGSRIGRAGDVTGDGIPDVLVGASGNDTPVGCGQQSPLPASCHKDQGQAFLFDGRDGSMLRRLDLPRRDVAGSRCERGCGSFGISVQGPGDTDRDGVLDQLIGASSSGESGRMYTFSGRTGKLLLRIEDPEAHPGATFGFQDAAPLTPGDVDRDGFADLYGNGFLQDGPVGEGQGKSWIFSGRTGLVIHALADPTPTIGGQFGWSASRTDHNRDSIPDIYVGQSPHHVPGADQSGGSYVFDGRTGALLRAFELPSSDRQPGTEGNLGPALGWSSAAPGDLNGDRQPDYVAGAPFLDVGENQDQGAGYAFRSGGR